MERRTRPMTRDKKLPFLIRLLCVELEGVLTKRRTPGKVKRSTSAPDVPYRQRTFMLLKPGAFVDAECVHIGHQARG